MDSELRELYQQVILDHHRHPRNCRGVEGFDRHADGFNPLCGDQIHVELKLDEGGGLVEDVAFTGQGCAICTASASMMTEALHGISLEEADRLFHAFHDLVAGEEPGEKVREGLGKLAVFGGVREFPVRVKCATLPWHTFRAALSDEHRAVSTE